MLTYEQRAKSNAICKAAVANTVRLFSTEGLDVAFALKRNVNSNQVKRKRKLDRRAEAQLLVVACGATPEGHARWTFRLLEEQAKIVLENPVSKDTIGRMQKTNFDLTKTTTGSSRRKETQNLQPVWKMFWMCTSYPMPYEIGHLHGREALPAFRRSILMLEKTS